MDDFRYNSSRHLIALEAATTRLLFLISSRCVEGPDWSRALDEHEKAYADWIFFLRSGTGTGTSTVSEPQNLALGETSPLSAVRNP